MRELWRKLRVGDRVQIAHLPYEHALPPVTDALQDETRELYEHLIEESAVLTIDRIDDWDLPWIDYEWVRDDGTEEFHSLALNHDGLELIQ